MDDLLLFTPTKKAHRAKSEDLLQTLLKKGIKYLLRNVRSLKKELQ